MSSTCTNEEDRGLEQLADEAFRLLGGQLVREARCGKGAYGAVWLAREEMTRRRIAVKVVRKDPDGAWQREYTGVQHFCGHLRHIHPHLLVIHHFAECAAFFCYSMEAADNAHATAGVYQPETLGARLRRGVPLPLEDVKRYGRQLMEALQCLHEAGLVHRDIKPDNIVFVNAEIKLADIGLVSLVHSELSIIGTPGYIPGEQLYGATADGVAQDVYALAKVLYACMSGYSANQFPKMPAAVSAHKLYPRLNDAILIACHPNPGRRFHSIREFLDVWNAEPASRHLRRTLLRVVILSAACAFLTILGLVTVRALARSGATVPSPPTRVITTPEPSPRTILFQDNFDKENTALWQVSDTQDRNAWSFGRRGLRWIFRANETDSLILALKGFELPATARISITLGHKGTSGSYIILFYNAAESDEIPFDFYKYRDRIKLISKGQVDDETKDIEVWKKPEHAAFNHFALVYASTLQGDGLARDELLIRNVTIRER